MNIANEELRTELRIKNIPLWKVARAVGVHETTFVKWMREELDGERKERVLKAVAEIEQGVEQ